MSMHAHYCAVCNGYSPCAGGFPASGFCLLVDRCVRCEGVPSDAAWRIHPDNAGEYARAHAEFHGLPAFMRQPIDPPAPHKDDHVHDEGACCECGASHCCCECPVFCGFGPPPCMDCGDFGPGFTLCSVHAVTA